MRINRWLVFGATLACVVGVALVVLELLPRTAVTRENFDRVEVGMTRAEVEAIFDGSAVRQHPWPSFLPPDDVWEDAHSDGSALVAFDENDRVTAKRWLQRADERTPFEKLLDRLPWRAKRAERTTPAVIPVRIDVSQ